MSNPACRRRTPLVCGSVWPRWVFFCAAAPTPPHTKQARAVAWGGRDAVPSNVVASRQQRGCGESGGGSQAAGPAEHLAGCLQQVAAWGFGPWLWALGTRPTPTPAAASHHWTVPLADVVPGAGSAGGEAGGGVQQSNPPAAAIDHHPGSPFLNPDPKLTHSPTPTHQPTQHQHREPWLPRLSWASRPSPSPRRRSSPRP